ncbi:xanthine dehydrogenase family protein subunit M [Bradyrhizobium neotropicale]|uniref:FAD binding domain-containing protein n=1 Tax=Bradyrhizobium neotropicale TaxID=1497615 RepID=UPI001AD67D4A|nr:xanthine dehydrogenase family protein subunit M [Bradyrhizobium neotropicale]MBO4226838.1 xanthine dehydrogenase family protein subunit M [Bradyrhizobium neotropicale]
MKPAPFELFRPETIDEALQLLADHQDADIKVLAGGQSLIPMMNFRVAQPEFLVDLGKVADFWGIEEDSDLISIRPMTRHADVKANPLVARYLPLVREAYDHVAHATIRNRGTLGGNLAHADPASEMPCVMVALDARFVLQSKKATRVLPAREFYFGPFVTAIEPDEVLVRIQVPKARSGDGFAFEEVSLRKGDFAISAVAARINSDGGVCRSAGIAIAGVAGTPVHAEAAETMIVGEPVSPDRIALAADAMIATIEFSGTATISAEYRRDLTRTLLTRALTRASSVGGV